jgi:Zn-dependent M16 (insulinase) family peptidase
MLRQESKSGLEASLVSSGHAYASTRLSADHSLAGALGEATGGVSMLESVKANLAMAENDFPKLQVLAPFSSGLLSK